MPLLRLRPRIRRRVRPSFRPMESESSWGIKSNVTSSISSSLAAFDPVLCSGLTSARPNSPAVLKYSKDWMSTKTRRAFSNRVNLTAGAEGLQSAQSTSSEQTPSSAFWTFVGRRGGGGGWSGKLRSSVSSFLTADRRRRAARKPINKQISNPSIAELDETFTRSFHSTLHPPPSIIVQPGN